MHPYHANITYCKCTEALHLICSEAIKEIDKATVVKTT